VYIRNLSTFKIHLKCYYSIITIVIFIPNKDLTDNSLPNNMVSFVMSLLDQPI